MEESVHFHGPEIQEEEVILDKSGDSSMGDREKPIAEADNPLEMSSEENSQTNLSMLLEEAILEEREEKKEESGVPGEEVTTTKNIDSEKDLSVIAAGRVDTEVVQTHDLHSKQTEGLTGKEKTKALIALKEEYVAQKNEERGVSVSEKAVSISSEDPPELQEKARGLREAIRQDLKGVDLHVFYKQFAELLRNGDKEETAEGKRQMISKLQEDMRDSARMHGGDLSVYTAEVIERVFEQLTSSEEMERQSSILYQERISEALSLALHIDKIDSTQNAAEQIQSRIDAIFRKKIPPEQKVQQLDALINRLGKWEPDPKKLRISDDDLAQLHERKNKLIENKANIDHQGQATVTTRDQEELRKVTRELERQEINTRLQSPELKDLHLSVQEKKLFEESVDSGCGGIVAEVVRDGQLERGRDGTFTGNIEGQPVVIAREGGRTIAYLQYRDERIHIAQTDPPAIGYDLARSQFIARTMGLMDVYNREDIRWASMVHPADEVYMPDREARRVKAMYRMLVRDGATSAEPALLRYHLLLRDRTVNIPYFKALIKNFDAWAGQGDYENLYSEVTPQVLEKLIALWKAEEQHRVLESQELRVYSLEEIKTLPEAASSIG